jgi:hypothetical protein
MQGEMDEVIGCWAIVTVMWLAMWMAERALLESFSSLGGVQSVGNQQSRRQWLYQVVKLSI